MYMLNQKFVIFVDFVNIDGYIALTGTLTYEVIVVSVTKMEADDDDIARDEPIGKTNCPVIYRFSKRTHWF